tara:strand:- start:379 stop:990 length:612 start_codon:yes stop_codon:yes gene_type:complete
MIKLVIFDLDGVLVDACEWHRIALNEALQEICNYQISLEDHYNIFNGSPTKVKLQKLAEANIISRLSINKIYDLKQTKTIKLIETLGKPSIDKINMISTLKSEGINVACCTNSIRETAELMLRGIGIFDMLDMVLTNEDVKEPKPDPEGYNSVINHFGLGIQQVVIVEDSPKGIAAALATGAKVYKVSGPNQVNINLFRGDML